ncbi:flavodoxin domain-containing protein [Dethiothermospora halolimnae]|uniref:flavodoxin domain-containing protein n=1 Tax=Dethiothermospora halolimnae TaxID=3114390 RepID=UPI003CCBBCF5
MKNTLIIYESKYGSTEKIVKSMAPIIGHSRYCKVDEFKEEYKEFQYVIIGSPVYKEQINKKIIEFIKNNLDWLKEKKVVIFCTCLSKECGSKYLNQLKTLLGNNLVYDEVLYGNLILDRLSKEDYNSIKKFYEKIKKPIEDVEKLNLETIIGFALDIKKIKDKDIVKAPKELIKEQAEKFIKTHNTCTLATGFNKRVRSTPIEYNYKDGHLYFITEGGEKFAHLLQNNNISISIYDQFTAMNNLGGMQILGEATIVEYKSRQYYDVLHLKKVTKEKIDKLPVMLNILKVKINKIEFTYSKFKSMGYDIKQTLDF